jgi:hypothetical protein
MIAMLLWSPQAAPLIAVMLMPFAATASATRASWPGRLSSSTRNAFIDISSILRSARPSGHPESLVGGSMDP